MYLLLLLWGFWLWGTLDGDGFKSLEGGVASTQLPQLLLVLLVQGLLGRLDLLAILKVLPCHFYNQTTSCTD